MQWLRSWVFVLGVGMAFAQASTAQDQGKNPPPPRSDDATRGPNDSSSKDSEINLSPPAEDVRAHPDSYDTTEVHEMHPYDPHRSDKQVEVADFYLKRQNYRAAISRYCEALHWMSNNAIATYRLATALEKAGDLAGARQQYENYLKILPNAELAGEAKKSIARIDAQPEKASKKLAERSGCEPASAVASSPDDSRQLKPISPSGEKSQ